MVEVRFVYDEYTRKWEVLIVGAATLQEAKQAFNAVVLTFTEASIRIGLDHTCEVTEDGIKLVPAVSS
jgi:hypothetical protein